MTAIMLRIDLTEPSPAQIASGRYPKRKVSWKGLTLAIENEAGTFRRGRKPGGAEWETLMHFAYGEVLRTEGVDGDPVDVYLGPHLEEAPLVYVVHQRCVGNWDAYDEDKCMLGFLSEQDAVDAFLACYDDPRFLGPVTPMPVAEFVAKARATRKDPAMIKALEPIALFFKARVSPYIRGGKTVQGYEGKHKQLDLFGEKGDAQRPPARKPEPAKPAEAPMATHSEVAQPAMSWDGPAAKPKKLVMMDGDNATTLAHEDESGSMHGIRDVNRGEGHDKVIDAWKQHASDHGHEIEDRRGAAQPDKSKKFYSTMVKDGAQPTKGNVAWLTGPHDTHEEAKAHVEAARTKATEMDPKHHFNSFGTGSIEAEKGKHPHGRLNSHVGFKPWPQKAEVAKPAANGKADPEQKQEPRAVFAGKPQPPQTGADGKPYDAAEVAARRNAAAKSGKRWGANKNKDDWKKVGDAAFGDKSVDIDTDKIAAMSDAELAAAIDANEGDSDDEELMALQDELEARKDHDGKQASGGEA